MPTYTVTIAFDIKANALTSAPSKLKVKPNDRIIWTSPDGDWGVQFPGLTPLDISSLGGPSGGSSGSTVRNAASYGTYKYTTAVSLNGQVYIDDPEVIVET